MARKGSKRPETIFNESEEQKNHYLKLSFQEILSEIQKYGFPRSLGDYLYQDIINFIHLYIQYLKHERQYVSGDHNNTEKRSIRRDALKYRKDLDKLGKKLKPWFKTHPEYQKAADLFTRNNHRLNKLSRVPYRQDEKDYAFMAAAGYGLLMRIENAKSKTYFSPSQKTRELARKLRHQLVREGFRNKQFMDYLLFLPENNTGISSRSLKGDIAKAIVELLSMFFIFEGTKKEKSYSESIIPLVQMCGFEITRRTVQRIITTTKPRSIR